MNNNQNILLADGRRLAYAEYGPADGAPVFAFHGTPGSRLEHAGDTSLLHDFNTRLIVVDRPGYGLSDYQQDRKLLDWPGDVLQLADALRIERFTIMGFSGGGAYAAACAFKIPERLTCVALLSSASPFEAPGVIDDMLPANRALFELAADDYRLAEQQLAAMVETPEVLLTILEGPAPAPDKAVFADENFRRMYTASLAESLRQGLMGIAYDMSLAAQPWGFDPAAINTEVYLWHGAQDINLPPAMARYLSTSIPRCHARIIPDAGHFLMFKHWPDILQTLTGDT